MDSERDRATQVVEEEEEEEESLCKADAVNEEEEERRGETKQFKRPVKVSRWSSGCLQIY